MAKGSAMWQRLPGRTMNGSVVTVFCSTIFHWRVAVSRPPCICSCVAPVAQRWYSHRVLLTTVRLQTPRSLGLAKFGRFRARQGCDHPHAAYHHPSHRLNFHQIIDADPGLAHRFSCPTAHAYPGHGWLAVYYTGNSRTRASIHIRCILLPPKPSWLPFASCTSPERALSELKVVVVAVKSFIRQFECRPLGEMSYLMLQYCT